MKQIYTTLIALVITATSFANSITAVQNGNWSIKETWKENRLPANGDSVIIPSGIKVTLDDLNDLDQVIILIAGTLDFDNGKLRLDDASRVIIQTTGKITGVNSNNQISIGNVFKFKGVPSIIIGYSYADKTTGVAPNGFLTISAGTLPVTFQSFYTTRESANVKLTWVTSQELNNSHFEVERSTDGRNYKTIAVVMGAVNSNVINKYNYTDKSITNTAVYYRIRQVDINGQAHYSAIRMVKNTEEAAVTNIYASAKQTITVDFNSDVKNNVTVQVVNMNGQVVVRQEYKQAAYRITLDVAVGNGIYAVRVSDAAGWSEVKKLAL
jgi:cytochrome c oxidase assembly protein Cox11